jgi:hypothetical protein
MKWKKNFSKFPKEAEEKISALESQYIQVICIKSISKEDIINNNYGHIAIRFEDDSITYKDRIIPSIQNGRYSKYNRKGRIIVRDDLPKVEKYYSFERPNYGDYSKGTHDISFSKKVKQKEIWVPEFIAIKVKLIEEQNDKYTFKFEVDDIIDKTIEGYKDYLMFHINLLQENCGDYDIHEANITDEELINTLYVDWELLPPGSDKIERFINSIRRSVSEEEHKEIRGRYKFIKSLKPSAFIKGKNKFSKYFGAEFDDDIVILENIHYGNAIYVFYGDWEKLTKLSRTELLRMKTDKFTRIVHTRDWEKRVKGCLSS